MTDILLGFEVPTGQPVYVEPTHMIVTGITSKSGKTTTLHALAARSKSKVLVFKTKPGEEEFAREKTWTPFFSERADWQYVQELLEATMREKMKFERYWIITATKGTRSLREVDQNCVRLAANAKEGSLHQSVYTVAAETPILIRDKESGLIDTIPIQDLRARLEIPKGHSEVIVGISNLEVLGRNGFTPIKWLSMHKLDHTRQVICPTGSIRVSDSHSLLSEDGQLVRGDSVEIGMRLLTVPMPKQDQKTWVHPDVAWLYGLFVAEGSCGTYRHKNRRMFAQLVIYNKDKALLERAASIYHKYFGYESVLTEEIAGSRRLKLLGPTNRKVNPIITLFDSMFYTKYRTREKKVPTIILNAQKDARLAFLEGYNLGDGSRGKARYQFQRFTTKSETLALGLRLLVEATTAQRINTMLSGREGRALALTLNVIQDYQGSSRRRKPDNVVKFVGAPRNERVGYDIETEDHTFVAGTGNILTHNTNLHAYFEIVLPELEKFTFSSVFPELAQGINVMDLTEMSEEMQSLVIRSCLEHVLTKERGVITIIPEIWKYAPEGRGNPVKRMLETLIKQGATKKNFVWIDSQDLAGVDKGPLKQVFNWILGLQTERNEVKHTIDQIPLPKKEKPSPDDVMTLKLGHFILANPNGVKRVYVQPVWMSEEDAWKVAKGESKVIPQTTLTMPTAETKSEAEEKLEEVASLLAEAKAENRQLTARIGEMQEKASDMEKEFMEKTDKLERLAKNYESLERALAGIVENVVDQKLSGHPGLNVGSGPTGTATLTRVSTTLELRHIETTAAYSDDTVKGRILCVMDENRKKMRLGDVTKLIETKWGAPSNMQREMDGLVKEGLVAKAQEPGGRNLNYWLPENVKVKEPGQPQTTP